MFLLDETTRKASSPRVAHGVGGVVDLPGRGRHRASRPGRAWGARCGSKSRPGPARLRCPASSPSGSADLRLTRARPCGYDPGSQCGGRSPMPSSATEDSPDAASAAPGDQEAGTRAGLAARGVLIYAAVRVLSLAVAALLLHHGRFRALHGSLAHLIVSWDS